MKDYRSDEAKSYRRLYNTKAWRTRRLTQLSKEPLCRYCAKQGLITPATIADHVVPHRGDLALFWSEDLQSLCKFHHDSTAQRKDIDGEGPVQFDADGYPIQNR